MPMQTKVYMDYWKWGMAARNSDYKVIECDCTKDCVKGEKECHAATALLGDEIVGIFKVPFKYGWLRNVND